MKLLSMNGSFPQSNRRSLFVFRMWTTHLELDAMDIKIRNVVGRGFPYSIRAFRLNHHEIVK